MDGFGRIGARISAVALLALAGRATAAGPGELRAKLGLSGGRVPFVPVVPEGVEPGTPEWLPALARAMGVDARQHEIAWLPPRERGWLAADLPRQQWGRAARALEDLAVAGGANLRLHLLSAWIYEELGRDDLARDRYRAAETLPETLDDTELVRWARFRMHLRFGEHAEARRFLDEYEVLARAALGRKEKGAEERLAAGLGFRGLLRLHEGDPRGAALLLAEASGLAPAWLGPKVDLGLATALAPLAGERLPALAVAGEAVKAAKAEVPAGSAEARELAEIEGRVLFGWLKALAGSGHPDAARARAEAAAKARTDGRVELFLAQLHEKSAAWAKALDAYQAAAGKLTINTLAALARAGAERMAEAVADLAEASRPLQEVLIEQAEILLENPRYRDAARILRRGRRREAAGELDRALVLFRQGRSDWDEIVQFPLEEGRLLIKMGRLGEAEAALRKARTLEPDRAETNAWLALAILSRGDAGPGAPAALPFATRAAELGESALTLHAKGWALAALGDHRNGAEALRQARDLAPDDPSIRFRLGLSLLALGLEAEALEEFRAAGARSPSATRPRLLEGLTLARMGRRDEALGALSGVAQRGPDGEAAIARATLARLVGGQRAEAGSRRPEAGAVSPGPPLPSAPLAASASRAAEKFGPAFERYRALADEVRLGRLDAAKTGLAAIAEEHPGFPEPRFARAVLELLDEAFGPARDELVALLDLRPADPRGTLGLSFLALRQDDPKGLGRELSRYGHAPADLPADVFLVRLERRWDEVLDADPYRDEARRARGLIRLLTGNMAGAEADLAEAGAHPAARAGRALVALARFARGRKPADLELARGRLKEAGLRETEAALDAIRREVIATDEPWARKIVSVRSWDDAIASQYMTVSCDLKALVLSGKLEAIDAKRAGLLKTPWDTVDRVLTAKKVPTRGAPAPAEQGTGYLDYDVMIGARPAEGDFPAPGLGAAVPFDLPAGPVLPGPPGPADAPGAKPSPPPAPGDLDDDLPGLDDDLPGLDTRLPPAPGAPERRAAVPGRPPAPESRPAVPAVPARRASDGAPSEGPGLLALALEPLATGRLDLAAERLERLASTYPAWESPLADLALLHLENEAYGPAREVAARAGSRFGSSRFWRRLEAVAAARTGRGPEGRELLRLAARSPERGGGETYREAAVRAWARVLDRDPDDPDVNLRLARLAFMTGDATAARTALAAVPDRPEAERLGRMLAALGAGDAAPGG